MKTIAIQRGLDNIKFELENSGYKVLFHDEIDSPIDAYIYYGQPNEMALVNTNSLLNSTITNLSNTYGNASSPILINAYDKSTDQIISIIENKLYSPLF